MTRALAFIDIDEHDSPLLRWQAGVEMWSFKFVGIDHLAVERGCYKIDSR